MAAAAPHAEARQKALQRFNQILADLLVQGTSASDTSASWSAAAAEALKRVQIQGPDPKYFSGRQPRQDVIAVIDAVGAGGAVPGNVAPDDHAALLCGDFFNLCFAMKPRPGAAATIEDPNFDAERVERFFNSVSTEVQEKSLESLGQLIDTILEQGVDELAASPAKLRGVLVMVAHPRLADPADESIEVMHKVLALVQKLHEIPETREQLARWFAAMPIVVLERFLGQIQQFLTLSLLVAQADIGSAASLDEIMRIARTSGLARHVRNGLRLVDLFWRGNDLRREHIHCWMTRRKVQRQVSLGELPSEADTKALPFTQFHNDAINDCEGLLKHDLKEALEMKDNGKRFPTAPPSEAGPRPLQIAEEGQRNDFGIVEFPFALTTVSKVRCLNIDLLYMQRNEIRNAVVAQMFRGRLSMNPFLVLKVRRNAIIEDALQQLHILGASNLRKPLKIVFDSEEGVDEGGVQKEFFQLLIEELYNEDFGMFERLDDTRNFWFNKNSFEAGLQFELFGIVLGLAIYNQAILDVKFPQAIYKKLLGGSHAKLGLSDLMDFSPSLAQGLIALLEHEGKDSFQDVFGEMTFVVQYECFGSVVDAELKDGGKETPVTWENREEYIQKYCDWIFGAAVERQFSAFYKGFDNCVGDTLFRQLFRPEELELVICGEPGDLDFNAWRQVTTYQDGYDEKSQAVIWMWEVLATMTSVDQRVFLQFCTGCDRAPVGGLGRLTFVVSRAGPDSDLLPSVHTCFNHLLVPDYASKEKLEQLLRRAMEHCHGFGLM